MQPNAFSTNPNLSGIPPPGMMMGPSFGSNPNLAGPNPYSMPSSFGGMGAQPESGRVVVEITRLLDMPIQETFTGGLKQYRVRAFDDSNKEIGKTEELAGVPEAFTPSDKGGEETIRLGEEGFMTCWTSSPIIHLQVEYAGGFFGNMRIGRCQIARGDQRSSSVWPYALSNKKSELVGCGIELKVSEAGFPPPMGGMPPTGPGGMPIDTMRPMQSMPPGAMGSFGPGAMGPTGPPIGTIPPMGPPMTVPPGMMGPMGPGGPSFQTMGPNMGPMGPGGPSFQTMPFGPGPMSPGGPDGASFPTVGPGYPGMPPGTPPGSAPGMGPSFRTMPQMDAPPPYGMGTPPGTPPRSGAMQPSFHTMAPQQMGGAGGQNSFMQPQTVPPQMMPQPGMNPMMSQQSMNPMMSQPDMNPMMSRPGTNPMMSQPGMNPMMSNAMMNPMMDPRSYKAKSAYLKPSGRDVTILVNQLINANGIFDMTRGATIQEVFKSNEDLQVHGPGVMQPDRPGGGGHLKDFPLTFSSGSRENNLFALFNPEGLPPVSQAHMFPTNPAQHKVQVVALIDIEKIIDLPAPSGGDGEVMLTLERPSAAGAGKSMSSIGPFSTGGKGDLRSVTVDGKLIARLTMQDLAQGTVQFRVCASYKGGLTSFWRPTPIGSTAAFYVTWKPEPAQFVPLLGPVSPGDGLAVRAANPAAVGGIWLSHRFVQDSPELYQSVNPGYKKKAPGSNNLAKKQSPDDLNGASGQFEKGGQGAILEAAALAIEGQNRALHQRIQIEKSAKLMDDELKEQESDNASLVTHYKNGYRNWKSLDSVFITMGPNYVAQSSEIGVPICKVYEDKTSIWKELASKNLLDNPSEEGKMKEFIYELYRGDPREQMSTLRPIVCKSADTITRGELDAKKRQPLLSVTVHSALNLRTNQGFMAGKVRPKVIIEIPGKPASKWTSLLGNSKEKQPPAGRFETKSAKDGKNIEWNQEGIISGYNYGDDIKVMVVDEDFIGWDEHLGEARIPGADFYPQTFYAEVPLFNASKTKGNTDGTVKGEKGASLLLEVKVLEPNDAEASWPPYPPMYAPLFNVNASDAETQRLANWDIHQNAKLAFADVSTNYNMSEDIWGALDTGKSINEGITKMQRPDWRPKRVKDECLMA